MIIVPYVKRSLFKISFNYLCSFKNYVGVISVLSEHCIYRVL